ARTTITEAAGVFAVSRQTIHIWRKTAEQHGISALLPKTRRPPQQPNAMEPWEVEVILAEAIARPTLGAASLLESLAERGVVRSRTGVQKILVRHKLGTRAQRVAVLAGITAADTGLLAPEVDPVGFCHFAGGPGDLVAVDAFYVGKVRHEAPCVRVRVRDPPLWPVAAGR
ncbi:MAG: helix-turn-helix domain-containing protein, partial [Euzebya sp.]